MKTYKGMVIEQGLADPSMIKKLKVLSESISPNSHWHLYMVKASEKEIEGISRNLSAQKWYAHFWNGKDVIVAYKDKIMRFKHDKKETWKPVVDYGLSIGIPIEQLDFPID